MTKDWRLTDHLEFDVQGRIAWCRVNRPEARNALTKDMYAGLGQAVVIANTEPAIEALIITGTDELFIPGGDLGTAGDGPPAPLSSILPWPHILSSVVPIITAVNGPCFASGLMFAMLSDIAVASDRATFRIPELIRGFPDTWMAAVLPAHIGVGRARELAMTNRKIGAAEALAIGLVERVVPHIELDAEAEAVAIQVLETAPVARALFRQAVNTRYGVVDTVTMNLGPSSPEVLEGFTAFIEKRPASWSQANTAP